MQRVADEPRQVRKEATAVRPSVCRGKPGPFFSFDAFPSFGRASLLGRKSRKGAIRTLSFKSPTLAQSEWMLDLLTAIAASLKDSLTVGWAKQVRATSSALPPYSMWAQAAAIISEAPLATI